MQRDLDRAARRDLDQVISEDDIRDLRVVPALESATNAASAIVAYAKAQTDRPDYRRHARPRRDETADHGQCRRARGSHGAVSGARGARARARVHRARCARTVAASSNSPKPPGVFPQVRKNLRITSRAPLPFARVSCVARWHNRCPSPFEPFSKGPAMMLDIKKILVPLDFSANSELALDYARAMAQRFGAALHLVHVCEMPAMIAAPADSYLVSCSDWNQWRVDEAQRLLIDLQHGLPDMRTSTEVLFGNPARCIVKAADVEQSDLIVMGTHGHGPIMHVLLGNVAERVVRTAPCPC